MSCSLVQDESVLIEIDDVLTTVDAERDGDCAWLEIQRKHSWCVDDREATLEETDAPEPCPDWVEELLRELGIEAVAV